MIDLGSKIDIHRLYVAQGNSQDALDVFCRNRKQMLEQFVGSKYSDSGARFEVLVNLLGMTADAYTIGLAAQEPRVRVTTKDPDLWPFAYSWSESLNNFIEEIHFCQTLQMIVLDAFFTIGIAKVFQADWKSIQTDDDVWVDPGRPYIKRLSIDNVVMDMSVKDLRDCRFISDEYRVSYSSVVDNPNFDKSVVAELAPESKYERAGEEAAEIASGGIVDDDDYEPMITLRDTWIPELKAVAIFPARKETKPLQVLEQGPEGGPYKFLTFADVPDNVMPTSPAQNLMGLHMLYNGLARKMKRQAMRQKSFTAFRPIGVDDMRREQKVSDGGTLKVADPKNTEERASGGVHQGNFAFSLAVRDLFSQAAGNLDAMAGLGAQTGTVGQEELIHGAVSRKEAKMQARVHQFTVDCIGTVGHLMWADQFLEVPASFELSPGTGVRPDASWTPKLREGDPWQYKFNIEKGSMNYEPPEAKLAKMERAMDRFMAMYPILQAGGGTIDIQQMVKDYADMLSAPEMENWITFATPSVMDQSGQEADTGMPQNTTRTNIRRNIPTGGTQQSRSSILQQVAMGGGQATPQQMATL